MLCLNTFFDLFGGLNPPKVIHQAFQSTDRCIFSLSTRDQSHCRTSTILLRLQERHGNAGVLKQQNTGPFICIHPIRWISTIPRFWASQYLNHLRKFWYSQDLNGRPWVCPSIDDKLIEKICELSASTRVKDVPWLSLSRLAQATGAGKKSAIPKGRPNKWKNPRAGHLSAGLPCFTIRILNRSSYINIYIYIYIYQHISEHLAIITHCFCPI